MTAPAPPPSTPKPGPPKCGLCTGPLLVRPTATPSALLPTVRVCPKCDCLDLAPGAAPGNAA